MVLEALKYINIDRVVFVTKVVWAADHQNTTIVDGRCQAEADDGKGQRLEIARATHTFKAWIGIYFD
jgi:hypothetical protein